jgi:hypothetical protein
LCNLRFSDRLGEPMAIEKEILDRLLADYKI